MKQENIWTTFQAHLIEAPADLQERQQTPHQGGYHTGTANNAMEISMEFANLSQATARDCAAVINLTAEHSTLTE